MNKSFDNHFVCLGMLLEALKEHQVTVYTETNNNNWIEYYNSMYTFTTVFNINVPPFDRIIKLSSHDDCIMNYPTISILHLQCLLTDNSTPFISCTPYITGANVHYMFPIFRPLAASMSNDKTVTMIGFYMNGNIDADTDAFIKMNHNYRFIFITWGDSGYSNLTKHDNVRIMHNVKTPEMFDILNKSRYALSKKFINYDRYSGQLGMAMSLEKPLIIDAKTASAYNLPGLVFTSEYSEIGMLDNISEEKYDGIVDNIRKFNTVCHNNNYQTMQKLLN